MYTDLGTRPDVYLHFEWISLTSFENKIVYNNTGLQRAQRKKLVLEELRFCAARIPHNADVNVPS